MVTVGYNQIILDGVYILNGRVYTVAQDKVYRTDRLTGTRLLIPAPTNDERLIVDMEMKGLYRSIISGQVK